MQNRKSMSSSTHYDFEYIYNSLVSFCIDLDFLADPNIEERMVCSLDCCIGNNIYRYFEAIRGDDASLYQEIIGLLGLQIVRKFESALKSAIYYDGESGFSQEPRWKEFSMLAAQLSNHIKCSMKKHKS